MLGDYRAPRLMNRRLLGCYKPGRDSEVEQVRKKWPWMRDPRCQAMGENRLQLRRTARLAPAVPMTSKPRHQERVEVERPGERPAVRLVLVVSAWADPRRKPEDEACRSHQDRVQALPALQVLQVLQVLQAHRGPLEDEAYTDSSRPS